MFTLQVILAALSELLGERIQHLVEYKGHRGGQEGAALIDSLLHSLHVDNNFVVDGNDNDNNNCGFLFQQQ